MEAKVRVQRSIRRPRPGGRSSRFTTRLEPLIWPRDAEAFQSLLADDCASVDSGRLVRAGPAASLARIRQYFGAVAFLEWDDIEPPEVKVSDDGSLATMTVRNRVTVIPAAAAARPRAEQLGQAVTTIFAWTEVLEKREGAWKVTLVTSTREPDPAATVLAASVAALGAKEARDAIRSIRGSARGQSPKGPYTMTIDSVADGRMRFYQTSDRGSFEAWVNANRGWTRSAEGPSKLNAPTISMLRGHEFQLMPMVLPQRFSDWQLAGRAEFGGQPCEVLRAKDDLGQPAQVFIRRDDQRLAGFIIQDPRRSGTVRVDDGRVAARRGRSDAVEGDRGRLSRNLRSRLRGDRCERRRPVEVAVVSRCLPLNLPTAHCPIVRTRPRLCGRSRQKGLSRPHMSTDDPGRPPCAEV